MQLFIREYPKMEVMRDKHLKVGCKEDARVGNWFKKWKRKRRKGKWKIKIEKRFEENMKARFNPDNAVRGGVFFRIKIPCQLCETCGLTPCKKCPFFSYFETQGHSVKCIIFIKMITNTETLPIRITSNEIIWPVFRDKKARDFLKFLRKEAGKVIRFA